MTSALQAVAWVATTRGEVDEGRRDFRIFKGNTPHDPCHTIPLKFFGFEACFNPIVWIGDDIRGTQVRGGGACRRLCWRTPSLCNRWRCCRARCAGGQRVAIQRHAEHACRQPVARLLHRFLLPWPCRGIHLPHDHAGEHHPAGVPLPTMLWQGVQELPGVNAPCRWKAWRRENLIPLQPSSHSCLCMPRSTQ